MSAATSPSPPATAPGAPPDPFLVAADLLDPPPARWVPHDPHPPQRAFLDVVELEALYGGAAGGGKSDALLMAALEHVHVPGYAALLLRRTFPDLNQPGALIPRSKEWLSATTARWNSNEHRWYFPSGATLTFGHLQHEDDKLQYQGAEYQFVGFDELTQFTESQYSYLASRLRRPGTGPLSTVPLRLRGATNPGGPGHRWVRRRLIDRLPNPDDPEDTPEKCAARRFVPAKLADNPSVDQAAYVRSLAALDPQTRLQLLNGDWNAREPGDWVIPVGLDEVGALGAAMAAERKAGQLRPPVGGALVLAADWGVHAHLLILWPLEAGGFHVVREVVNDAASIRTVAPRVADEINAIGWPLHSERFDASMPGLNDAFLERLRPLLPWKVKYTAVPFSKFKALTMDYLRLLAGNTHLRVRYGRDRVAYAGLPEAELRALAKAVGEQHEPKATSVGEIVDTLTERASTGGVLAIDEQACPVLAEQIRQWRYADPDTGRVEKGDDHGPDALIAGVAPEAARRRPSRPQAARTG